MSGFIVRIALSGLNELRLFVVLGLSLLAIGGCTGTSTNSVDFEGDKDRPTDDGDSDAIEDEIEDDGDSSDGDDPDGDVPPSFACPLPDTSGIPRGEHPRPDFCRREFVNLNGPWSFAFDPDVTGEAFDWGFDVDAYTHEIQVPFSWQSTLSGIADTEYQGVAWYTRSFVVPENWNGQRVHLVFGAVDWSARVWVNDRSQEWSHEGGYTPFRVDITDALISGGENRVFLRVEDPGNDAEFPHGKQGSPWYTNCGGIWQTVYLEPVPDLRIDNLQIIQPDSIETDPLRLTVKLTVGGDIEPDLDLRVYRADTGERLSWSDVEQSTERLTATLTALLDVDTSWIWSPETPTLVPLTLRVCNSGVCDAITTYTGLRTVEVREVEGVPNPVIHVNGEPTYIRMPLVQGYHPEGLMTYPSEGAIVNDLRAARDFGFNGVRLHIKPEEPLVLYHADRLGLLVDYDMVNLGNFPIAAGDTETGRARWESTMREQVLRDRNHPSVIWWTLFNETWGLTDIVTPYDAERQSWVLDQLANLRELVPGQLAEDMSPTQVGLDHVETDILSWHFYLGRHNEVVAHLDEVVAGAAVGSNYFFVDGVAQDRLLPLINTEFGPFSYEPITPGWKRDRDISNALRWMLQEFRVRPAISGYVFTELYDVEFEHNGLMDYDRGGKVLGYEELAGGCSLAAMQGDVYVALHNVPSLKVAPGESVSLNPWVSSYRPERVEEELTWRLSWPMDADSELASGTQAVNVSSAGLTWLDPISFVAPVEPGAYVVAATLGDACNYLPVIVLEERKPGWSSQGGTSMVYSISPANLSTTSGEEDTVEIGGAVEAAGFLGQGMLTAEFNPFASFESVDWSALEVAFEAAANERGMPQTDAVPFPTTVIIKLNGIEVGREDLADDWADARGLLSHHFIPSTEPTGGYGRWVSFVVTGEKLTQIQDVAQTSGHFTLTLESSGEGGLIVYGLRTGRYAVDPNVTVRFNP